MDENPYYLEGGNIEKIIFTVYVKNIQEASEFYGCALQLEEPAPGLFKIPKSSCMLQLKEGTAKIDTGITFVTDSVFVFHRKLVDEGVEILQKPAKNKDGNVEAVFTDYDGNKFRVLEIN